MTYFYEPKLPDLFLGLLCQYLTKLCHFFTCIMDSCWMSVCPSICLSVTFMSVRFSFSDGKLSKHQWIFTKLVMCIDIVVMGKCCQMFTELSAHDTIMVGYYTLICHSHMI